MRTCRATGWCSGRRARRITIFFSGHPASSERAPRGSPPRFRKGFAVALFRKSARHLPSCRTGVRSPLLVSSWSGDSRLRRARASVIRKACSRQNTCCCRFIGSANRTQNYIRIGRPFVPARSAISVSRLLGDNTDVRPPVDDDKWRGVLLVQEAVAEAVAALLGRLRWSSTAFSFWTTSLLDRMLRRCSSKP